MKNKEIIELHEGLLTLKNNKEIRLPASTTYAIVFNLKIIAPIVETITETSQKLLQTYGEPSTEEPGSYFIPPKNREKFIEELEQIDDMEVDVGIKKIKWEDIKGTSLTVEEMGGLFFMIEG